LNILHSALLPPPAVTLSGYVKMQIALPGSTPLLGSALSLKVASEAALPAAISMRRHGTAGFFRVWRSHPFKGGRFSPSNEIYIPRALSGRFSSPRTRHGLRGAAAAPNLRLGEVAEWLNAPHSKCGIGASLSGVRIPPSPPLHCSQYPIVRIDSKNPSTSATSATSSFRLSS
jgi:hypothetical protein